jgi:glycine C-acetyltransferase
MARCSSRCWGRRTRSSRTALNHASIIDGIRLSQGAALSLCQWRHGDLEAQLKAARAEGARFIMIATDGVFSMDGYFAPWPKSGAGDAYGALVMVDDCHATGFMSGRRGAARRRVRGCGPIF